MCSVGWVMTASVKSSLMCPLRALRSIRAGTVHRPTRWLCPLVTWILTSSFGRRGRDPASQDGRERPWQLRSRQPSRASAFPAGGRSATSTARSS